MHTYSTTYYEAYWTGEMVNLYPELVMVYNSNYHLKWSTPMTTGQVCCQAHWHEVRRCEGESPESFKSFRTYK
jgi:hypothetical protein